MSNFYQLGYCWHCVQMTNHTHHDNVPKPHQYTMECMSCGLKTHESEWAERHDRTNKDSESKGPRSPIKGGQN